ncbi:S41 family peptidase [Acidocella sp.]|uniref:S41 family peptidase n=1 Tax=Acidocella sp. TaxID=50710 RepID=UPI0026076B9F|nr:S41 family peptidase [Acidocella sp.]
MMWLPATLAARPAMAAAAGFDPGLAGAVWSAALAYIAPRSLQPLTLPQMTMWGLNGLAALDPDLTTNMQDGQIRLYGPNALLLAVPAPGPDGTADEWGQAAAQVAAAAYGASPALQQAGTQGIISNFFDELFNHFDPYSRYESPDRAAQDELMILGLAGTGVTLSAQGGHVVIGAVAADSPAANAGLLPGQLVLAMDGRATSPAQIGNLNAAMNGVNGSTVRFSIIDPEAGDGSTPPTPEAVTLTRALIPPPTVFTETPLAPGIAVLRITGFNKGTGDQFSQALGALMQQTPPPHALVLDLRGNRGGVLSQAVLVADSLMGSGLIAETQGRDPDADQQFKAEGADLTNGAHIAVLVDGQTASAAEILSSALADNDRAVVIGSGTLGKGLVQTLTALPDGGELFITWSRVLAARGWPLQGLGVMPQVCTSLGSLAAQTQLNALDAGHNLMGSTVARERGLRAPVSIDTELALRDQCPAAIGTDLDLSVALNVLNSPTAYQAALVH